MSSVNIYKNEQEKVFENIFKNPPPLFRGTPFWSWNNRLDIKQLIPQIDILKEMGFGGFHMHSRTGMGTEYLSDDFMDIVKACVDKAKKENMIAWLYDEDRWPSGAAGGLVTKEEQFRSKYLIFTPEPYCGKKDISITGLDYTVKVENGYLLAKYAVILDAQGCLAKYWRLGENEKAPEEVDIWYAYLETMLPVSWFNNQAYIDTLNESAIKKFIEITHERYKDAVGNEFGKAIPAIFTDEPQFAHKQTLAFAAEKRDVALPFTGDLVESFQKVYRYDILDYLPEVIWELPDDKVSQARYHYHDHIAERFAHAFADQIGAWCKKNNLCLTGHVMGEENLYSQTCVLGEAMRSYRSFQLPGVDMLCDRHEYTTVKQAQSASRQYGCGGVLSELYGVTGWDFNFAGHKSQGDWQAAMGVTVRVHHLAWVSMAGEAKRDYPASINYQSPWYKKYSLVENHFSRVNTAMTRGKSVVKLGVIHPVESYWISFGPRDQTAAKRKEMEYSFQKLCKWLLFGLIDFDYICESQLPMQNQCQEGTRFTVGKMNYDVILVPPMRTIRSSTLERLEAFAEAEGEVIFAGEIPAFVDAKPSKRAAELANSARHINFAESTILDSLAEIRELEVVNVDGTQANSLLYQLRSESNNRYLFICNSAVPGITQDCLIRIRGKWQISLLDTSSGEITKIAAEIKNGITVMPYIFHPHGHLLLKLEPCSVSTGKFLERIPFDNDFIEASILTRLESPVPVTLDEPNALLLDQAQWRLDDGEWQAREELLRLDNLARAAMGLNEREGLIAQPWISSDNPKIFGKLEMRFEFDCMIVVESPLLAIENPAGTEIFLDGTKVDSKDNGWWVDEAIRTVALPVLSIGSHELIIRKNYNLKTNIEWCYILGNFGVELKGNHALIVKPVDRLCFGNIASQGLPFYTGNITYHCNFITTQNSDLNVRISHFSGAMVDVKLNGLDMPAVAYAPYESALGTVKTGKHSLDLTLYGNRFNAFGPLHCTENLSWPGPNAWRTTGDQWTYEYAIKPQGILFAPVLRN